MNTISILSMVCVVFELYHLFFYKQILSCSTPIMEIQRATKYLETSVVSTIKMIKIVRKNKWLNEAMDIGEDDQLSTYSSSVENAKATRKTISSNALLLYIKDYPFAALWYLLHTALELIFWATITFLSLKIGGIIGIALITWNFILSQINEWLYNHDNLNRYWNVFRIVDSICNIIIYFVINYFALFLASS